MHFARFSGVSHKAEPLSVLEQETNYLHLDGLYTFASIIRSYGYYRQNEQEHSLEPSCYLRTKNSYFIKAHILCRLTILIQTAALIVFNLIQHCVRAVTFFAEGVLAFDFSRIRCGFKDLVGAIFETLLLPIMGVVAFFSPAHAAQGSYSLAHALNPSATACVDSKKLNVLQKVTEEEKSCYDSVRGFVFCFLERCTAPVNAVALAISLLIQDIFALNLDRSTLSSFALAIFAPFTLFSGNNRIKQIHGIE